MKPNPRDYDTPDDYDDAMNDYIAYMESMYDRIDMEIEKIKEDKMVVEHAKQVNTEIEELPERSCENCKWEDIPFPSNQFHCDECKHYYSHYNDNFEPKEKEDDRIDMEIDKIKEDKLDACKTITS